MDALLLHVDKAPEFFRRPSGSIKVEYGDDEGRGTVDYADCGKLRLTVDHADMAYEVSEVRLFVHPELLARIRAEAPRRTIQVEVGY